VAEVVVISGAQTRQFTHEQCDIALIGRHRDAIALAAPGPLVVFRGLEPGLGQGPPYVDTPRSERSSDAIPAYRRS
jgi:hypothetical protein